MSFSEPITRVEAWLGSKGWAAFEFQRRVWAAMGEGKSGLLHSATGTGKTYAVWLGALLETLGSGRRETAGLHTLWITPLRALAADTAAAIQEPIDALGLEWQVETRTGDTSSATKTRQKERLPQVLVTTPESLTLLLSYPTAKEMFRGLRTVVLDEWHELMSSKRGVQAELALARLRAWNPALKTWGVSATIGNLEQAKNVLLGPAGAVEGVIVQGETSKVTNIDSLLPEEIERFPWAGHLGTRMLPQVVEEIEKSESCLLFTNTRSQTEIWFQAILAAKPEWKGCIEVHHGSIDREVRSAVEEGIKWGKLKAVVCTSSLDLGVDFSPVDRVLQVGSPRGVARLLQRAGRSGHQPGAESRISFVPTFALELIDVAAIRDAAQAGVIESRAPIEKPLDVLVQHLVTIALGGGFSEEDLLKEVRTTYSYRDLAPEEWKWALDFVTRGGGALSTYPDFNRVVEAGGVFTVEDRHIARRHRMSIGTITSDSAMVVQYYRGHTLGTIEESFISRLNPGDKFVFSGKPLQFVRTKDMAAIVKPASSAKGAIPRWMGGRLPLSAELSSAIRLKLEEASQGELPSPEMQKVAPLLKLQQRWSAIPSREELLVERVKTREGHHLYLFPFEGRLVHEGLAALLAYRLSRLRPITFTLACNDYGIELLSPIEAPFEEGVEAGLLSTERIAEDVLEALNASEMARRQFREIARIAGLIFQGFPGAHKSTRQIQASSSLFYDVFAKYDPENLLLYQARVEVLERQLESTRLASTLHRLSTAKLLITNPPRPTPLSFPILVDRLRETVSSEPLSDRISKMVVRLEREADREETRSAKKKG